MVARVLCQLRISVYLPVYLLYTKFYESAINSFGLNSVTSVAMAQFSRTSILSHFYVLLSSGAAQNLSLLAYVIYSGHRGFGTILTLEKHSFKDFFTVFRVYP